MEPYSAGWLSVLPPIIAITLAIRTKEVYSSLLTGILVGTAIHATGSGDGNILIGTVETAFKTMVAKFDLNIVMFCSMLGGLIYVISLSGGAHAYGRWAIKRIRGRRSALASTSLLGGFIFIDDYFNCLTVGTVMRPITDAHKISRAKLAYIIDSTAAPVCIIAPISSWAVAVGSNLRGTGAFESEMAAFMATIPWNFYALLCIFLVLLVSLWDLDFGAMRHAERMAREGKDATRQATGTENGLSNFKSAGTVWDMLIPILALIVFSSLALLYVGGYWGKDPQYHSIAAAFGHTEAGPALVLGSFGALVTAFVLFVGRGLLSIGEFMDGMLQGIKAMLPANLILVLAWTISGVCRDLLQTQAFIGSLAGDAIFLGRLLPAFVFVLAGFLSFSTGTAWGTFGILIPIVVTVAQAINPGSELVNISLSATLAGSVFGDHCSPISDTTVLSSASANCTHIDHVSTQLTYAILTAACSLGGYLVAGITYSLPLSLAVATLLLLACVGVLHSGRDEDVRKD